MHSNTYSLWHCSTSDGYNIFSRTRIAPPLMHQLVLQGFHKNGIAVEAFREEGLKCTFNTRMPSDNGHLQTMTCSGTSARKLLLEPAETSQCGHFSCCTGSGTGSSAQPPLSCHQICGQESNWQREPQALDRTKNVSSILGNHRSQTTTPSTTYAETRNLDARDIHPASLQTLTYRRGTLDLRHCLDCTDEKYHENWRTPAPILALL